MSLFPRPSLPELDARIARTLVELQRSNGEAYTELLGTVAYLRAMRAQVELDAARDAAPELLAALKALNVPDYPLSDCEANRGWILAQRAIAKAEGRTLPPEPTGSKGY